MTWIVVWVLSRMALVPNAHYDDFGRLVHSNEYGLIEQRDTLRRAFSDREAAWDFYRRARANMTDDGSSADRIVEVWVDSVGTK